MRRSPGNGERLGDGDAGTARRYRDPDARSRPSDGDGRIRHRHGVGRHPRRVEPPDPDKTVQLENPWNQSVEIRISVVREATNETVHEGTYTLDPGTEREVYDVADADPDGVESFRVTAIARTATGTVTIETGACSTDAHVEITSSGDPPRSAASAERPGATAAGPPSADSKTLIRAVAFPSV